MIMDSSNDKDYCIKCGKELIPHIDDDSNGTPNPDCAQCRAEENYDFDEDPKAQFDRRGNLIEPARDAIINLRVDSPELRDEFKAYCARRGWNMRDALNHLIRQTIDNNVQLPSRR